MANINEGFFGRLLVDNNGTTLPIGENNSERAGSTAQYFEHDGNTYIVGDFSFNNDASTGYNVWQVELNADGTVDAVRDPDNPDFAENVQLFFSVANERDNDSNGAVFGTGVRAPATVSEGHSYTTSSGQEFIIMGSPQGAVVFRVNADDAVDSNGDPVPLTAVWSGPLYDAPEDAVGNTNPGAIIREFDLLENFDDSGASTGFDLVYTATGNGTAGSHPGVAFTRFDLTAAGDDVDVDKTAQGGFEFGGGVDPTGANGGTIVQVEGETFYVLQSNGTNTQLEAIWKYNSDTETYEFQGQIPSYSSNLDFQNAQTVTLTQDDGTERVWYIDGYQLNEFVLDADGDLEFGERIPFAGISPSAAVTNVEIFQSSSGEAYVAVSTDGPSLPHRIYRLEADGTYEVIAEIDSEGTNGRGNTDPQFEFGVVDGQLFFYTPSTIGGTPIAPVVTICFAGGTKIKTPEGDVSVEDLRAGMKVSTADNGVQSIRWIGSSSFDENQLKENDKLKPIRICAGALGNSQPKEDLLVSPQHRLLVSSPIIKRMFDNDEVLVAAKHLCDIPGIYVDTEADCVQYFHILLDNHEILFANGMRAESLLPGPQALKSLAPAARKEIKTIFPVLFDQEDPAHEIFFTPARKVISRKQAHSLAMRTMKNGKSLLPSDSHCK